MPRLIVNPNSGSSWEIQLKAGPNLIGRAITNDFQIREPSVSGTHCRIFVSDGLAQITDLGSTNGTFVNRQPITEAPLEPQCSIRLGDVELLFCPDSPPAPSPSNAPASRPQASPGFGVPPAAQVIGAAALSTGHTGKLRALQHCRFHSAMPARYVCSKCGHYFCEACVGSRTTAAGQQKFCRRCGVECPPVQVQFEEVSEKGFLERVPGAFLYPLRGAGVVIVIVGIVMLGLVKAGQALFAYGTIRTIIFGVILEIFAGGYLFAYLQGIIHSTEAEDRELPDLPGIANFAEDVIVPFLRFLALIVICFAPAIGAGIWLGVSHQAGASYALAGAAVFGLLYFPMAFLAVATLDSVTAANPLLVVPSILKAPLKYIVALLPLAGTSALQWFGSLWLIKLFPEGWTTHAMGEFLAMIGLMALLSFLSFYLIVVAVHLLGLIFVTSKSELGWLEHQGKP